MDDQKTKAGVKTTEFWVSIAPVILGLIDRQQDDPDLNMTLVICSTALGMAYIVSRTMVKKCIKK